MTDPRAGAFVRAAIEGAGETVADRLRAEGAALERELIAKALREEYARLQRAALEHSAVGGDATGFNRLVDCAAYTWDLANRIEANTFPPPEAGPKDGA